MKTSSTYQFINSWCDSRARLVDQRKRFDVEFSCPHRLLHNLYCDPKRKSTRFGDVLFFVDFFQLIGSVAEKGLREVAIFKLQLSVRVFKILNKIIIEETVVFIRQ